VIIISIHLNTIKQIIFKIEGGRRMKKIVEIVVCTLLIGIIILSTFSVCVLSSDNINIKNDINIKKTKYFSIYYLRSYLLDRVNNYREKYLNLNKVRKTNEHFFNIFSEWSPTEIVSTESTANTTYCSIATDSADAVHVVWEDETNYMGCGSDKDIFYKMKPKGGTWTSTEVVSSESSTESSLASIAVESDGTVHVTWDEYTETTVDVYYKMKPFGGSWTTAECISLESCDDSGLSSLVVDLDGNVHVAMTGINVEGDTYIYYKMKPFGGSWTTEELVTYDSQGYPYLPTLDFDSDGGIHIAWEEMNSTTSIFNIYYKMKTNGGSWTAAEAITNSNILASYPSLVIDRDDNVHVTWSDLSPYYWMDICYRMKLKNGGWSDIDTLSINSCAMMSQISAGSDGSVSVVFDDIDLYGSGNYEIFYRSKPSGGDWTNFEIVTDDFNQDGMFPSIAIDSSGCVHVAWEGYNYDNIYYKNNGYVNLPPEIPIIDGETSGKPKVEYEYTFNTTDPNNNNVYYYINWSDGTPDIYIGPFASGETAVQKHIWAKKGTYTMKAKAIDVYNSESDWATLEITIPKDRSINNLFLRLLDQFPHMFSILRHLMGL